jgi:hypothetical protein
MDSALARAPPVIVLIYIRLVYFKFSSTSLARFAFSLHAALIDLPSADQVREAETCNPTSVAYLIRYIENTIQRAPMVQPLKKSKPSWWLQTTLLFRPAAFGRCWKRQEVLLKLCRHCDTCSHVTGGCSSQWPTCLPTIRSSVPTVCPVQRCPM